MAWLDYASMMAKLICIQRECQVLACKAGSIVAWGLAVALSLLSIAFKALF